MSDQRELDTTVDVINKLRGEYWTLNGIADTCASFNSYTVEDKYTFRGIIKENNNAERSSTDTSRSELSVYFCFL